MDSEWIVCKLFWLKLTSCLLERVCLLVALLALVSVTFANDLDQFCIDVPDKSYVAHPDSCEKMIICVNSEAKVAKCREPYLFDATIQDCRDPQYVECDQPNTTTTHEPTGTTQTSPTPETTTTTTTAGPTESTTNPTPTPSDKPYEWDAIAIMGRLWYKFETSD